MSCKWASHSFFKFSECLKCFQVANRDVLKLFFILTPKLCAYDLIMTVIRLFTAANFEFNIIHFTSKAIRHFYLHANSKTSVLKLPTFNQYLLSFNHFSTTLWILLSCIKLNVVICLKNDNTQRTRHLFSK